MVREDEQLEKNEKGYLSLPEKKKEKSHGGGAEKRLDHDGRRGGANKSRMVVKNPAS